MDFSQLDKIGTDDCRRFAAAIFARHGGIDKFLKSSYIRWARDAGYRSANLKLAEADKELRFVGEFSCVMDDESICDMAVCRAKQCDGHYKDLAKSSDIREIAEKLGEYVESCGVDFPLDIKDSDDEKKIIKKCMAAIVRVCHDKWWRRRLRVATGRQTEAVLRDLGYSQKRKSPYVSNYAFARWQASQRRNKKTMAGLEAVNEEGEILSMDDCIKASVSNPENMRAELMVRMRGFEEVAQGLGYAGLFLTLTCPSKYHARHAHGPVNKKYNGSTPADSIAYLSSVWARIRAKWARGGVKLFGFRVAEPHHDGTPHFHFLLFCNPVFVDGVISTFRAYAMEEDGGEEGAEENRCDVVRIDAAKGSAAAYIAKYVAKNLDGYAVGVDDEGECLASEGGARARAWASLWGIRQFQQIGSVSVTVWRELRRRRGELFEGDPEELKPLLDAATNADWRLFVELMGGPVCDRTDMLLRPQYHESEGMPTRYGEALKRLIGVWMRPLAKGLGRLISTREHVWSVRERAYVSDVPKLEIISLVSCRLEAQPPE